MKHPFQRLSGALPLFKNCLKRYSISLIFVFFTIPMLISCGAVSLQTISIERFLAPYSFQVSNRSLKKQLDTALSVLYSRELKSSGHYPLQRMLAAQRIASILLSDGQNAQAARFLLALADEHDMYESWYLFAAASVFETMNSTPVARILYERILETLPDAQIHNISIHQICLKKLLESDIQPERKAAWYREFIRRFPDSEEIGMYHFLLAKEYEKLGQWSAAIDEYRRFLPYFGVNVPGYPDAHAYARKIVELNDSAKDWTYADLHELVAGIRKAIASRNVSTLRKYMSKAGFFAMSWYKEGGEDANSNVLFNFSNFMTKGPITVAAALDPQINEQEAFLRTSGWTGYIPVWYLCFRKVYFPADPRIHGNWEWAGIYFGEKLQ